MTYLEGQEYTLLLVSVMVISGIIKKLRLMDGVVQKLCRCIRSPKILAGVVSAVTGILPIKGRVIVSAGILNSIYRKSATLGPLNYISTHHYYLWSPLEKAVIIAMGAFGLSYVDWLILVTPVLVITGIFICWYIYACADDIRIDRTEMDANADCRIIRPYIICLISSIVWSPVWSFSIMAIYCMIAYRQFNVLKYIDWKLVCWFVCIITLSNFIKMYSQQIYDLISVLCKDQRGGLLLASTIGFASSLLLGSSSRFSAVAVILTLIFGVQYLLWFYIIDFAGYILSPAHKCVSIGKQYFNTPLLTFYGVLLVWVLFLIICVGFITFI